MGAYAANSCAMRAPRVPLLLAPVLAGALLPLVGGGGPVRAGAPYAVPPPASGTVATCDIPIAMSDGVHLRADLTTPDGPTVARPTILTVTGYNKSAGQFPGTCSAQGTLWATHGYNYVVVDDRGSGNSEGQWTSWDARTHQDYGELLDWLTTQSWSDGTVATTGGSYLGITSLFVAEAAQQLDATHPGARSVKAVWADV